MKNISESTSYTWKVFEIDKSFLKPDEMLKSSSSFLWVQFSKTESYRLGDGTAFLWQLWRQSNISDYETKLRRYQTLSRPIDVKLIFKTWKWSNRSNRFRINKSCVVTIKNKISVCNSNGELSYSAAASVMCIGQYAILSWKKIATSNCERLKKVLRVLRPAGLLNNFSDSNAPQSGTNAFAY